MNEIERSNRRTTVPALAILAAGIVAGGAWEIAVNLEPGPGTPSPVEPVLVVAQEPAPPPTAEAPRLIPPPPVPAPVEEEQDLSAEPTFTPFTAAPRILNRDEVVEAMRAAYPPLLRAAGVSGTTRVYFFIDAQGEVQRTLIDQGSGRDELDAAALEVAAVYRFAPARLREDPVPVWVSFGITFTAR